MSDLPKGWTIGSIADLVDIGPRSDCEDSTQVGFIPMNRLGAGFREIPTFETRRWSDVKKGYTHFADGDVLLARITPCFENGKAGIPRGLPSGLGAGSTEYIVLRPKPGTATAEFILARLKTKEFMVTGARAMTGAVGQQRVPKAVVGSYPIPIAPFPEQQRISKKLTTLLANVDACRERLDRVPQILKNFREAVLEAAVSGKLTEEWRESRGARLNSWSIGSVGELVTKIEAGLNVQCEERPPEPGEKGLVKISAVTWGTFDEDESKTLPMSREVPESARIRPGDFLISRANTLQLVGACVIVSKVARSLYLSDKVLRLRTEDRHKPWLLISLRSLTGRKQIESLASGNQLSMRNLSQANLRSIKISLPPEAELMEIIRRVDELLGLADRAQRRYEGVASRIEKLTPSILAKAFRGELVPQDPHDEPAESLLNRIRQGNGSGE